MKEFINKLIAKLEEIPTKNKCSECPHKQKCDEIEAMDKDEQIDLCGATIKALAIDAVKELAEDGKTTNADRIRSMTDEELAEVFAEKCNIGKEFAVCWLQNKVEGVTENEYI